MMEKFLNSGCSAVVLLSETAKVNFLEAFISSYELYSAVTMNVYSPAFAGVPLISPVDTFRDRPSGS